MWRKGNSCTPLVGMQTGVPNVENTMEASLKTKRELPHDPAIPPQGIYLKEIKTLTWKDMCIPMYTQAL